MLSQVLADISALDRKSAETLMAEVESRIDLLFQAAQWEALVSTCKQNGAREMSPVAFAQIACAYQVLGDRKRAVS